MTAHAENGERAILRRLRALAGERAARGVRVGIGDDCAVLTPRAGEEMLVTTDFSIEGRHFHLDTHPPEAIGHKCLARGLSDIAAMGGRPVAAFLSLALPRALAGTEKATGRRSATKRGRGLSDEAWVNCFFRGLLALAEEQAVTLAGGDLSEAPMAVADITVVGAVPKGRAMLRSTARSGDQLYVTGRLGGAAAELATLRAASAKPLANTDGHPHFYPQPRTKAGQALLRRGLATACIDVSDGLSVDLLHLCEESHVQAEVQAAELPVHPCATLEDALHGGDDYELLFTAAPHTRVPARLGGVPVRRIGRLLAAGAKKDIGRMTLVEASGKRRSLAAQGWQHF